MISQNDLYDVTYALIVIRNNIQYELNNIIIVKMEQVLKDRLKMYDDNQIRRSIATIENLAPDQWDYVFHNNVYVNQRILKDENIYKLLIKLFNMLIQLLEEHDFERAYDLVDCFHCLPEIIANNNFIIPKSYWKIYVKEYRNKWDKFFLKNEEKYFRTLL